MRINTDPSDDFGPVKLKTSHDRFKITVAIFSAYFLFTFALSIFEVCVAYNSQTDVITTIQTLRQSVGADLFNLVMIAVGYYLSASNGQE